MNKRSVRVIDFPGGLSIIIDSATRRVRFSTSKFHDVPCSRKDAADMIRSYRSAITSIRNVLDFA